MRAVGRASGNKASRVLHAANPADEYFTLCGARAVPVRGERRTFEELPPASQCELCVRRSDQEDPDAR